MKKILPDGAMLSRLACPICGASLSLRQSGTGGSDSLYCSGTKRHCYDLSASGYVNLMPPGHASGGDSKQAVRARSDFLNLEYYRPVAEGLRDGMLRHLPPEGSLVIDAGCGEGYYTSILGVQGYKMVGIDLSKFAVDAAAKRAARLGLTSGFFSVSSVFELPFREESADGIINVFAPCAEIEFRRVLRKKGILAVVYAGPDHLMGLKQAIYEETRGNDGRADLPTRMTLLEELRVRFDVTVEGQEALQNLFAMTPYYWRTSPADAEKLKRLEKLTTAVDVIVSFYQNN